MPTAITASEFRKRFVRRAPLTLPCGITLEVRRIDIDAVLLSKQIKVGRVDDAAALLTKWNQDSTEADRIRLVLDHLDTFAEVIDQLVMQVVVAPRVVATPDEAGTIYIADLVLVEKLLIINKASELLQAPAAAEAEAVSAAPASQPIAATVADIETA